MSLCTFTIPGQLPGLNSVTNANRTHWAKGAALKKKTQKLIGQYIVAGRVPRYDCPVSIEIEWIEPNAKRDPDNVCSAIKFLLDGLVETGRIPNDTRKFIRGISHQFNEIDPIDPRVIVTLIPMEGDPHD